MILAAVSFYFCQTENPSFKAQTISAGSGIVSRLESSTLPTEETRTEDTVRIQKLANFQIVILSHALRFKNVQRVVYSTCSLHELENENVVQKVSLSI